MEEFESEIDGYIINILKANESNKIEFGKAPVHTGFNELINIVKASLNRLSREKKIKVGETATSKYINVL